jgi:hypothetical protein
MTSADRLRAAAQILAAGGALGARRTFTFAMVLADLLEDVAADKDSGLSTIHPRLLDLANLITEDPVMTRDGTQTYGVKAGDPIPGGWFDDDQPACPAHDPGGYLCTAPAAHSGPHVATTHARVVAVWS